MNRAYTTIQLLFCSLLVFGQYSIPEDIPTPNATNIAKYGDVPMSYYTGRANINIPLFSTEVLGLPFSISMDYDTSGILFNSLPGWTGQNWTLNAGGVITRSVQVAPDEFNLDQILDGVQSYFSNHNLLAQQECPDNIFHNCDLYSFWGIDLAPDIFTFNFMGKSGKFFLGNDGQWKVQSEDNLDIIYDVNDEDNYQRPFYEDLLQPIPSNAVQSQHKQPKVIRGFVIRDENGYLYKFGYNDNAIEYTVPIYSIYNNPQQQTTQAGQTIWQQTSVPWKANSWYLTEVKDRHGNILYTLDYERGYFIAQFYVTAGSNFQSQKIAQVLMGHSIETSFHSSGISDDGVLNSPVYLRKIRCANGLNYTFERTAYNKCIHSLYPSLFSEYRFNDKAWNQFMTGSGNNNRIEGKYMFFYLQADEEHGGTITNYQFLEDGDICCNSSNLDTYNRQHYKYYDPLRSTRLCQLSKIFLTAENSEDSIAWTFNYNNDKRMFLSSVSLGDRNDTVDQKFTFTYNNATQLPEDYLSTAVDHWGYFNGFEYSYAYIHGQGTIQTQGYREPNEQCMRYGMLNRITFPTGGYLTLEYEANRYTSFLNEYHSEMTSCNEKIAGGLRISCLKEYEKNNSLLNKRTFTYRGGELYLTPKYQWNWYSSGPSGNTVEEIMECSTSIFPLSNIFGPHIGYSQITENVYNGNKTIYNYSNFSGYLDDQPLYRTAATPLITPYDRFSSHDYRHGRLLSFSIYDSDMQMVDSVQFEYEEEGDIESEYVISSNYIIKDTSNPIYKYREGCIYKIYYPRYKEKHKKELVYNKDGSVLSTETDNMWMNQSLTIPHPYQHSVNVCMLRSTEKLRQGESFMSQYTYPVLEGDIHFLSQHHLTATEVANFKNGSLISKEKTFFDTYGTNNLWCPKRVIEESSNGDTRGIISFNSYTDKGRPVSYDNRGHHVNLIWDPTGNYIIQKSEGYKLTTNYSYNPFGRLTSVTYNNGYAEYYSYDTFGRLIKRERKNGNQRETINLYNYKYCIE